MTEITIDTSKIVEAALIGALGEANSEEFAKAMAKTLLEGPGRYSYHKNLLQELMHNAVSEIASKTINELLRGREEEISKEVRRQLGKDLPMYAADVIVKRIKESKVQ